MCCLVTIVWPCSHTVETFVKCEGALILDQGKDHAEADIKFMAAGVYYRPCNEVRLLSTPNPKEIPFCRFPSCVPNYWSCCQCKPLKQFGSLSGDECGTKHVSRKERLERLAPTSSAKNAERDLQQGEGVCGDDMDEERRAGYGMAPSVTAVPCSVDETCYGCQTENHVNDREISLEEMRVCMDELQDVCPLLLEESEYDGKTDCGHLLLCQRHPVDAAQLQRLLELAL
ncbi:hypothetical protein SCUCBS95973_007120 [Sporothrix curviconia]|uniref:Uncharacterized protein n=1 Tax=Sporothrix curviconia TaxID=1260050 RepID=A0ABP0CBE6_9PEZI